MRYEVDTPRGQGSRLALLRSHRGAIPHPRNNQQVIWLAVVATLIAAALTACGPLAGKWRKLSVLIQDDRGKPVTVASVRGLFYDESMHDAASRKKVIGHTDHDGQVVIDILKGAYIDVSVEKDGYYPTLHPIVPLNRERQEAMDVEHIRLREQVDPIAMYAKRVIFLVQGLEAGEKYGYDFVRGDFVSPVGDGVTTDIELSYLREFESPQKYHWSFGIKFVNPTDGLIPQVFDSQGSEFRSDYEAPPDGYRAKWTRSKSRGIASEPPGITPNPNQDGFYFRVRTEVDDVGTVVGGHYGKFYGSFPKAVYYLNPDPGNRNVEYDVSQNLFGTLPILERAAYP